MFVGWTRVSRSLLAARVLLLNVSHPSGSEIRGRTWVLSKQPISATHFAYH
jgi:hypothetical protein